jgi:hypothetical protein
MSKDKDYFSESDMTKSKILHIEEWLDAHKNEIVDFVERKISEKNTRSSNLKIPYEITNRIVYQLTAEFPFGPDRDWVHYLLADALMSSVWCGWLSQAMVNKKEPNFNKEYLEQFQRAINKAYELGRMYASQRP